jgi:hypothetical protein
MEALTRLVTDSLARHGLDRPVDPRRLQWSRWFRCDSPHSLLVVPSKPGIFALAEEVMNLGSMPREERTRWEGHDFSRANTPGTTGEALSAAEGGSLNEPLGGAALQRCESQPQKAAALAAESHRMLAVLQFSEDDNIAFVLDRMFTYANPMRSRLHSGNCFVRFVIVEDHEQRRGICAALNQWMRNSAERATGLPADFSSSLELAFEENVARAPSPAIRSADARIDAVNPKPVPMFAGSTPDSGANKNLHCPHPLPSGF